MSGVYLACSRPTDEDWHLLFKTQQNANAQNYYCYTLRSQYRIHRKILRIFKIVKANQSQLKLLKTYIYKNVLLFLSDVKEKTWTESDIVDR